VCICQARKSVQPKGIQNKKKLFFVLDFNPCQQPQQLLGGAWLLNTIGETVSSLVFQGLVDGQI